VQARFALPLYSCHRRRPHQYSRMHTPPARAAGAYGAHHCAT
jgi:ribosomal protein L34E